jgi:hypothetical protein
VANDDEQVLQATRRWLERAVVGLNLCPFAKAVYVRQQVRFVLCDATDEGGLRDALRAELQHLAATPDAETDTTLLVHPQVLQDFHDYNQFLDVAEAQVRALGLEGVLQVASFHPQYCFHDCAPDAIENYSNRSPYPTLHLLRESSIDRAVAAFPDAERIYGANIATLRALGHAGWQALWRED